MEGRGGRETQPNGNRTRSAHRACRLGPIGGVTNRFILRGRLLGRPVGF